jgi:hypothetical protein
MDLAQLCGLNRLSPHRGNHAHETQQTCGEHGSIYISKRSISMQMRLCGFLVLQTMSDGMVRVLEM